MDPRGFDALTRKLATGASRRTALRAIAGGGLASALALIGGRGAAAQDIGTAADEGTCRAPGDNCSGDVDCCSERCSSGRCLCRRRGAFCEVDRACCSGRCRKARNRCA